MNLYLNDSSLDRLHLISKLTLSDVEFLANNYSVDVFRSSDTEMIKLIWSTTDERAYILIVNPEKGVITMMLPAQHGDGYPKALSVIKYGQRGFTFVKRSHIESAMRLVGESPITQEHPDYEKFYMDPRGKIERTWHYRWMLRFMTEAGPKVKNLCNTMTTPSDDVSILNAPKDGVLVSLFKRMGVMKPTTEPEVEETDCKEPPLAIIEKAREHLTKVGGWNAQVCLVERDAYEPILEWEL